MINIISNGSITSPKGFKAGATYAGLKSPGQDKYDLGIIYSDSPSNWAGVFTKNKIVSPSVTLSKSLPNIVQGIVVNSGSANCCVGSQGMNDAKELIELTKNHMNTDLDFVLCSTGVIGVELPMGLIRENLTNINVEDSGGTDFAKSIITTDTTLKEIAVEIENNGKKIRISGVAKGSGMIHPNMATMLAFITTDAKAESSYLKKILSDVVEKTFNQIDVDGDTSTNDSVIFLANGESGENIDQSSPIYEEFLEALQIVANDLSRKIAIDAEGAQHLITVNVNGATNDFEARLIAREVVSSNLVKTAVYGRDPNWGRIMMAIGNSECKITEEKIKIFINDIQIVEDGKSIPFDPTSVVSALTKTEVNISIDIGLGKGEGCAWGRDLTEEYVVFNSAYRT
jgi:glutamate N-acetyltransferase/amino-acid N-acetyltransferase